ncbi:AT-hook motif nuclear-localized protein 1 isoform X1 [Medicago truncatula]|uniref:AT-hook motif nuclear-localized protein 1 isoform X1 n=1 Tax=Medicago truncatula TaxID=3880 RepID=UPI000D2F1EB1|nr:AT-hook motif nuclear-localized protein 1 isoform X1 [Medicago truncatula]
MEASGGVSGGVTVVGSDAPSEYHVAPRTDNQTPTTGSAVQLLAAVQAGAPPQQPPYTAVLTAAPAVTTVPEKKKRGRPRKYAADGSVTAALSPKPISSSAPLPPVIDFTAEKRAKVKPVSSVSKANFELENIEGAKETSRTRSNTMSEAISNSNSTILSEWVPCSVGSNFTPHIITVNAGEDVTMKVISFSQQGPRAVCILSANGVIKSVTLRQPDSSGGTLTYEGLFEILSLSGSFMPNESGGGTRSRSGGMSVSLASPDGRVVGGGVAGLLVAASPVQVVVGSFMAGNQHEQKPRNQKHDVVSTVSSPAVVPIPTLDPIPILSSVTSFRGDNWSAVPASDAKDKPATDINVSLPGG